MRPVEENHATETSEVRVERSIPELFRRLRDETATLFRQEVELAKAEMSQKTARISRNAMYLAVGGLVAYAGLIFLLLGVSYLILVGLRDAGVVENVAIWVAPMIVGVVVGAIGYGFIQKAISTLKRERVAPENTVQSLQENKEWLKRKMH